MAFHGCSLLILKDVKSCGNDCNPIDLISCGMKTMTKQIIDIKYKDNLKILDYDYEHLTSVLKIEKYLNLLPGIRITTFTPDALYEKNHFNVFSQDQNILMFDKSIKRGSDLKINDEISGVCGFKSIIQNIEYLDHLKNTIMFNILTSSKTFYIQGMTGIF